ncbi:MAG: HAD-IA family hydrolase [Anaerolineae bacterium]|nr:HAD-IA family hydrolase [Anaerolineae bacterium]
MRQCFRAIVFDFDYTLADSSRGAVACIDFALDELGLPAVSAEAAKRTIGLSLLDTFLELAGPQHAALAGEFARLFVKQADERMSDLTVLFESIPGTILELGVRGFSLGIVSTKFRYRIESVLRREGLLDAFAVIIGGEDVEKHKPDPVGLLAAIERLGGAPASTLYVGDSVTDAQTAERAGVPFVAVLSGVTPQEAFRDYAPCEIVEGLSDLLKWEGCQCTKKPSSTL